MLLKSRASWMVSGLRKKTDVRPGEPRECLVIERVRLMNNIIMNPICRRINRDLERGTAPADATYKTVNLHFICGSSRN